MSDPIDVPKHTTGYRHGLLQPEHSFQNYLSIARRNPEIPVVFESDFKLLDQRTSASRINKKAPGKRPRGCFFHRRMVF
jgi:hypothetical protein